MSGQVRLRTPRVVATGALLAGSLVALAGTGAPAYAAATPQCSDISTVQVADPGPTDAVSKPLQEMGVDDAQKFLSDRGQLAGQNVGVAVIDSGVFPQATIPVTAATRAGAVAAPTYYHGTDVAGLIAGQPRTEETGGAVGVAPGAHIIDIQITDDPTQEASDQNTPILAANVVAALQYVLTNVTADHIKVVNMSFSLPSDPADAEVASLIDKLWDAGVVTVAPTGNRPGTADQDASTLPSPYASFNPGENAVHDIHPADYNHVLAVNSSMTGAPDGTVAQSYVLQNSGTDLSAPTYGSISYSIYGQACPNYVPATSWAAALVSGVLAMDQGYFDESPARAVGRLINTANGRADIPNNLLGAGEVQAYAALTRPIDMDDQGNMVNAPIAQSQPQVLKPPRTPPDVLASTRHNAVWWGLLGGGALLLALLVRPVLARRRRA